MELSGRQLWQVGAGDTDRRFDSMCIDFDVMVVGPGKPGTFHARTYKDTPSVVRFYEEAKKGDIVILRYGTGEARAVGEIADDRPQHLEIFGDVDGWDMQHCRRVRWLPGTSRTFEKRTFGGQARTFAKVGVTRVREWVERLHPSPADLKRQLKTLPPESPVLNIQQLAERLFIEGLSSNYVDHLVAALESVTRTAQWYRNSQKAPAGRPSEHETICYLVMPVLLTLGWSQQTAAIEWNRIDVALFRAMPPTDKTLECVVEAKMLDRSVFAPIGQAAHYARVTKRQNCKRLIATDGIRYALYTRAGDQFKRRAYLNILSMRAAYPVLRCSGAVDAILGMAKEPLLEP